MTNSEEILSTVSPEVSSASRGTSENTPAVSDGAASVSAYQPDFTWYRRLDKRAAKHRRAEKELQRTVWGREVLPIARFMFKELWDEAIAEAIVREYANDARWLLKRRGHYYAWFGKYGGVPVELDRGFEQIKSILASPPLAGRRSKRSFHDVVAACAFRYRSAYAGECVPGYGPLARFLELPELAYPLTARRVGGIVNDVGRSFVRVEGPLRYPKAFDVCGEVGETLLRQLAVQAHTRLARSPKEPRQV